MKPSIFKFIGITILMALSCQLMAQEPIPVPKREKSSKTATPKEIKKPASTANKKSQSKTSRKARAEAGDPKAMFEYGISLNSHEERMKWIEKSANAGYGEAIWDMGTNQWNCGNKKGAAEWYKRGADKGDGNCMISYGEALEKGDGVETDKKSAYEYYKKGLRNASYSALRNRAKEGKKRLEEELGL